jgi:4-amino-4-deoxy-L-arabinose transferase-like glycosyltransferase
VVAVADQPSWPRRRVAAWALALTAAAALVRLLARPGRPMWGDEAFTLALVQYPTAEVVEFLTHREVNGGIYTLLVRALLALTGPLGVDPLTAARGLSMLFGVAAVPAFYLLVRRLAGERVALVAGLLLAVNHFHASYSAEARAYALAFLLVVLSSWALVALLERPGWRLALAFGLLAGLATWAHLFAALVLAGQALAMLAHPRLRERWGPPLLAFALAGGLSAAIMARGVWGDGGQVAWIESMDLDQFTVLLLRLTGGVRLLLLPWSMGLGVALLSVRRGGRTAFPMALAAALVLVPVLVTVAVSVVKPMLVPRYLLVALPGFLILAALGVAALRRTALQVAAALLLAVLGLAEVARDENGEPPWQRVDQVAARLVALARPGDVLVVSHPAMVLTLDRELARLGRGPGPPRISPLPGDPLDLHGAGRPPIEARVPPGAGLLFVLFAEQPQSAQLRAALAAASDVTSDESYEGVRLLRLQRR